MISQDITALRRQYEALQTRGLQLDLTRGKPSPEQLDLSNQLLSTPGDQFRTASGIDTRNYGGIDGLPEMKALFAEMLGAETQNIIVGGNSSLTMMFDYLARACLFGVPGGTGPWFQESARKFLCVVPGYDRHFGITEHLGFELLSVDMTDSGPNMDQVEKMVGEGPTIKGIWCVPRGPSMCAAGNCLSSPRSKILTCAGRIARH